MNSRYGLLITQWWCALLSLLIGYLALSKLAEDRDPVVDSLTIRGALGDSVKIGEEDGAVFVRLKSRDGTFMVLEVFDGLSSVSLGDGRDRRRVSLHVSKNHSEISAGSLGRGVFLGSSLKTPAFLNLQGPAAKKVQVVDLLVDEQRGADITMWSVGDPENVVEPAVSITADLKSGGDLVLRDVDGGVVFEAPTK